MAEERKALLLRMSPELWEQINRLAQRELRSTNAQIEFLLREAIKARGIGRDEPPPGPQAGDAGRR
jgi:hypothetical protein